MIRQAGAQLGRVIERDRANARLHDALYDSLTGLPNRPYFLRDVEEAFREYSLDRDAGFCVSSSTSTVSSWSTTASATRPGMR